MSPYILSFKLAFFTTLILIPVGLIVGRLLAYKQFALRSWVESLVYLPLVLPPTVLGFYLLQLLSPGNATGHALTALTGTNWVFSFHGLVLASVVANLPFAIQPVQQAFSAVAEDTREAAWVSGLSPLQTFLRIELPQCWSGILCAATLTFAHTLGEFGVILMVGGNIAGETRTLSIAIYDNVQSFDMAAANSMTVALLIFSLAALAIVRMTGYANRQSR